MSNGKDFDASIEMEDLLEQHRDQESVNEDLQYDGMRDVSWNGDIIKVYPLDHQRFGIVKWQIAACLLAFVFFGLNDQTTGSLMPILTQHYNVSKVVVSNIFLLQIFGAVVASLLNERLYRLLGMRGVMVLALAFSTICLLVLLTEPTSIYLYIACYLPIGFSIGVLDATSNVLFGNLLVHKNELMGILHGTYGAAAMVTPPLVTYFAELGHWNYFFIVPATCSVLSLILVLPAFRYETSSKYDYNCRRKEEDTAEDSVEPKDLDEGFWTLLRNPAVALYATYLLIYLGAEVSTGSWLLSYLLETKANNQRVMSFVTSSFWTGLTVGRLTLGFVTERFFKNQYRANFIYGYFTLMFYCLFVAMGWYNGHSTGYLLVLSSTIFFAGLFIGPLFPNASIVTLQLLPAHLHISGVGAAVAVGGSGAALFPYLFGILLHKTGMDIFPLVCTVLVAVFVAIWHLYPRLIKNKEEYL